MSISNFQERYNSRYLNGYRASLNGYEFARWQALYHFIKKVLKLENTNNFLDFGCGSGLHIGLWEKLFPSGKLYFADISSVALEQLIAKHPQYKGNCAIVNNDKTIFQDNSFDVITSIEVMEHVENLKAYLAEIHRLLKPGGIFIWTTPCANALSIEHIYNIFTRQIESTSEGYRRWTWEDPEHLRRLKSKEIKDILINKIGFSSVKFKFRAHFFSFVCTRLCKGRLTKTGERLMFLDYALFRNLLNGASMIGCARK